MTNPVTPPPLKPLRPAPDADPLPRIEALTRNARTTWFALLGALVFVGVTLLGVEHIDFWGVNRATQLPLVNVSVPTRLFFAAAPILTAAIYAYFHVYLIRLWEALGEAPSQIKGQPLGNAVTPWLVSDAALYVRKISRNEAPPCLPNRALDLPAALLNLALAWAFGLVVLWLAWRWSFPARDLYLSTAAGFSLAAAAVAGFNSLMVMLGRMSQLGPTGPVYRLSFSALLVAGLFSFAGYESWEKTSGPIDKLAPLSLVGAEIVTRPDGWTDRRYARRDFLSTWCNREGIDDCARLGAQQSEFDAEWAVRREAALIALDKPSINSVRIVEVEETVQATRDRLGLLSSTDVTVEDWDAIDAAAIAPSRDSAPNLQSADLRGAFLSGLDLSAARLTGAQLSDARLEGTSLAGADLLGANLVGARLSAADLRWALMEGATLIEARMDGADLSGARMTGAFFNAAKMEGANLDNARMEGANLSEARMDGTNLNGAWMSGANLSGAWMEGTDLSRVIMEGANLNKTRMEGAYFWGAVLDDTTFRRAQLQGTNFTSASLMGADFGAARLQEADLSEAQMERVSLRWAWMQKANLFRARMELADLTESRLQGTKLSYAFFEGADLSYSHITGTGDTQNVLFETNLSATTNNGGALRFVDLQTVIFDRRMDWRNAFLDGSVNVPLIIRELSGFPCQWSKEKLSDEAFYGRWRWWVEAHPKIHLVANWAAIAPEAYRDVPVNPGPSDCFWKTGPMNGPR